MKHLVQQKDKEFKTHGSSNGIQKGKELGFGRVLEDNRPTKVLQRVQQGTPNSIGSEAGLKKNSIAGPAIVQKFGGSTSETLEQLIKMVIESRMIHAGMNLEQAWPIVYDMASKYNPEEPVAQEKFDFLQELHYENVHPKNQGGFYNVELPRAFEYKERLSSVKRKSGQDSWKELRMTLNVVPDELIAVMGYLSRELAKAKFAFVTEFKCPNSFGKVKKRMDNIVIYYIENPDEPGQNTQILHNFIMHLPRMPEQRLFRDSRPAMSGPAGHPGIGLGEGHGSLIEPRAKIIAGALLDWYKNQEKGNPITLVATVLAKDGYSLKALHEAPKKKSFFSSLWK